MRRLVAFLLLVLVVTLHPLPARASAEATDLVSAAALLRASHAIATQAGRAKQSPELSQSARGLVVVLLQEASKALKRSAPKEPATPMNAVHVALVKEVAGLAGLASAIGLQQEHAAAWNKLADGIASARDRLGPLGRKSVADFDTRAAAAALRYVLGPDGKATTAKYVGDSGVLAPTDVLGMASELVVALGQSAGTKSIGEELGHALDGAHKAATAPCSAPNCRTAFAFAKVLAGVGPIAAKAAAALGLQAVVADLDRLYMPPV